MTGSVVTSDRLLGAARSARVLVIGDVMLDDYVIGHVARTSPEAPVPVVRAMSSATGLGGAANVANQLRVLGADVDLFGSVGDDWAAEELVRLCTAAGISGVGLIVSPGATTTRKQRVFAERQQVARIDWEQTEPLGPTDAQRVHDALSSVSRPDAVVVSDYAKGFVTPDLMALVGELVRGWDVPLMVDPKSTDLSVFAGASLIKVNRIEAEAALGMPLGDDPEVAIGPPARRLMSTLGVPRLVVTLGERGMVVLDGDLDPFVLSQTRREVFDVSGAGDTVMAVLTLGLVAGESLADAAVLANRAAGVVVSRTGVAVARPTDLAPERVGDAGSAPIVDLPELTAQVGTWRRQGRRVVFTNGCFDMLHPGHLHVLRSAAEFGDALVVAINGDRSVRGLKGCERPVVPEHQRADLVAAIDCVDAVVVFDGPDPGHVIDAVQPDVLVKGSDHEAGTIIGADTVLARGGEVRTVPLLEGWSTSSLLERIRQSEQTE